MSFNIFNFIEHEDSSDRPAFAINWIHYNSTPKALEKRNSYRARLGLRKIIDAGHYFRFEVWIRQRTLGFHIDFRPVLIES